MVFLLSLFNVLRQTPVLAYRHLVVDRATMELDGVGIMLPSSAGLLVVDSRWPGRAWALYMLHHGRVFDRLRPGLPDFPPEGRSRRLLRYAYVASGDDAHWTPGEPWGLPDQREVLWSGGRFQLLRRTDGALADLRLAHPHTRVGLDKPLRIETGRTLSVSGPGVPGGRITQDLEWAADSLELSITVPRGGVLWIREGERSREERVAAGTRSVRLPAAPVLDLHLDPPDEQARLWGVKGLASGDR
jgi:hypothetical protein